MQRDASERASEMRWYARAHVSVKDLFTLLPCVCVCLYTVYRDAKKV